MEPQCGKWRHRFRFGNSWWKRIVHIWRRCRFGGNVVNRPTRAWWQNRLLLRAEFRCRKLRKPRQKLQRGFLGLIEDEKARWIGQSGMPVRLGPRCRNKCACGVKLHIGASRTGGCGAEDTP